MLERANLEYVRVVPAFTQRRMREDEPRRFIKTEQALFVFQNQVICGNIIAELTAALELAVNMSIARPVFLSMLK